MDWRFVLYAADGSVRLDVPVLDGPLPQPIVIEEGDLGFFVYRGNPVHLRPGDRIERMVGWGPQAQLATSVPSGAAPAPWRGFWLTLGYRKCPIHKWVWTGRSGVCPFFHGSGVREELPRV